ncbi:MAG TPA: SGNH/GDSL hydrolase family protein [Candidatus Nanopelagicales bacterium]
MPRRILALALALVSAMVGVLVLAAPESSASPMLGPRLSHVAVVVALGDSVPYGTRCNCSPFPQQTATRVRAITGRAVTIHNDAVSGYRTSDVLSQLRWNAAVIAHVRAASIVEVMIGANDIAYTTRCGTTASCYQPALAAARRNTVAIVARIRAITAGRPVAIVLLGYWNAWLDGRYAVTHGAAYVATSRALTRTQNASILMIAQTTRSLYVDLWQVFRGVADADDTALLAYDGDHPNYVGHARIAAAIVVALRSQLLA